jgi:hypothetical protein
MNNPFKFKLENKMTKSERIESVAHIAYEELQKNGEVSFKFMMAFFPTWSEATLTAGINLALGK